MAFLRNKKSASVLDTLATKRDDLINEQSINKDQVKYHQAQAIEASKAVDEAAKHQKAVEAAHGILAESGVRL